MNQPRALNEPEKDMLKVLLQSKPSPSSFLLESVNELRAIEMNDGGMGSLLLIPKGAESKNRSFGQQLALGEFTDLDGVPVSVALNTDSDGYLYELDVWKVNFSPLLAWPDPADIKILG
jgi:hypothetical protein